MNVVNNLASKDIDCHVIGVNARKTTTYKCNAMQVIMNGVQAPAPFRHWLAVPEHRGDPVRCGLKMQRDGK